MSALLHHDASFDPPNAKFYTPLTIACEIGDAILETIQLLLECGASVDGLPKVNHIIVLYGEYHDYIPIQCQNVLLESLYGNVSSSLYYHECLCYIHVSQYSAIQHHYVLLVKEATKQ